MGGVQGGEPAGGQLVAAAHFGQPLLQGEVLDEDQIIAAYDAVTREDVRALARALFRFENASLSAVGRVGAQAEYQALLN